VHFISWCVIGISILSMHVAMCVGLRCAMLVESFPPWTNNLVAYIFDAQYCYLIVDLLNLRGPVQLSSSRFLRSSVSSRQPVISSSRGAALVNDSDPSQPRATDANFAMLQNGQRISPALLSSEQKPSFSGRNTNIKTLESTRRGIESLHVKYWWKVTLLADVNHKCSLL